MTDLPSDKRGQPSRSPATISVSYLHVSGIYCAVCIVLFWGYSVFRWIGIPTWLGASSPGLRWVPAALAATACVADVVGVVLFLVCMTWGTPRIRLLASVPGIFLTFVLAWILIQSLRIGVL